MDFHLRRRSLLDRAARIEEKARLEGNAQARDLMCALALLYKEMAEELGESGLFERRLIRFDFADLAGDVGEFPAWVTFDLVGSPCRAGH